MNTSLKKLNVLSAPPVSTSSASILVLTIPMSLKLTEVLVLSVCDVILFLGVVSCVVTRGILGLVIDGRVIIGLVIEGLKDVVVIAVVDVEVVDVVVDVVVVVVDVVVVVVVVVIISLLELVVVVVIGGEMATVETL